MKSLKDLTYPWIQRAIGLFPKTPGNIKPKKVFYRVNAEEFEEIEIEPEYPNCKFLLFSSNN